MDNKSGMNPITSVMLTIMLLAGVSSCNNGAGLAGPASIREATNMNDFTFTGTGKKLTEEQFCILVQKGTEPAFTGKYYKFKGDGMYACAACGNPIFDSRTKFESGSGWPSFWEPAQTGAIKEVVDSSQGMKRTEVLCGKCGGHLGHVFTDGPNPTGLRYCINSGALEFIPRK